MTTTTMTTVGEATTDKTQACKEKTWPRGSIATMFGLFAACVVGAGLVLLGVAELVIAIM